MLKPSTERVNRKILLNAFGLLMVFIVSCNPARRLPDNTYLLRNNNIKVQSSDISKQELDNYLQQYPNRKILGVYRFHLNVYQLADRGKTGKFKTWMKNTIGEPPVIYDRRLSESTIMQFEKFMHSRGYFNAEVAYEEKYSGKNVNVHYIVKGNQPYLINDIAYSITDSRISSLVLQDTLERVFNTGQKYNTNNLQEERNRISRNLRDNGYFRFSRDYLVFRVDSNLNNHAVNINIGISNPLIPVGSDSSVTVRHKRYKYDRIFVVPEYSVLREQEFPRDTTSFVPVLPNQNHGREYLFLHYEPLRIKPNVIVNHLRLRPNEDFSISNVEQTYGFLAGLRNFRFINIQFVDKQEDDKTTLLSDTLRYLDAYVQLNRSAANAFTVEAEGLNTAGNLGIAGNLLYQNRNVFKNAEIFNLRFKGALEAAGEAVTDEVINSLPFNTLELGVETSIDFPKLLLPFRIERIARNAKPKSVIATGINFRQRPDYTRYVLNLNYGFEWNQSTTDKHFLNPLEISSIRVFNDSILRANIPDANPFILSRFRDHFVIGFKHTYVLNTQKIDELKDFYYLRTNFESSGLLLNTLSEPLNLSRGTNGSYNVFNIPFSQFIKGDADFRFYRVLDENRSVVFRIMAGAGIPYGNADVMPFIKSYYGGGANGIRAWRIYSLGPGSYQSDDQSRFDRYGDIKLEANLEYRFRLYSFLHGAFFLDAGNVWFIRENEEFPGGEFKWSSFGRDIAMGGGLGIRMDFDFFILRVDTGIRLKDPAKDKAKQYIDGLPTLKEVNFNLGIGYPF